MWKHILWGNGILGFTYFTLLTDRKTVRHHKISQIHETHIVCSPEMVPSRNFSTFTNETYRPCYFHFPRLILKNNLAAKMKEKMKKTELTMKDVFVECGSTVQNHGKLCKSLRKIYNNVSLDEFWAEFIRLLKYSMMIYAREPVVERTIDFVTKFVSSLTETSEGKGAKDEAGSEDGSEVEVGAEENPLLSRLITFLLQSHSACNQSVRFRSCQLINKLLNGLGDNAHIDDDLYEGIFSAMLERVRDKLPLVRVQAVLALARLQDPADKDCPVIKAYLFLISCDPSPDVRRAVLTSIAPSTKTLSAILERTRDVKDAVRKAAYQVIADKIHIKALSIAQRLQLLEDGLNDRAESVVKACGNQLLQGWLRASAGNVLELLKNLDVESSVETCERALTTMFTASSLSELVANFDLLGDKMLMDQSKLNGETAMYWSSLSKYVHSLGHSQEQLLEMVLPACVHFCDYLRQYLTVCRECTDLYEQLEHEFVLQQLLNMTTFMDLSDQAGRKALQKLLDDLLLDAAISHSLVRHVMPHLVTLYTDTDALVTHLAETISDIREPISVVETQPSDEERRQSDLKLARVRVDLNQLREDMDEAIHQQDFVRAAEVKEKVSAMELIKAELTQALEPHTEEVRTEKTDPQTWMKCLSIVCELLENASITSLTPVLQMLVESLILPAVQKEDPNVRNLAMKALGLCCLLKKEAALQNLVLFVQASQVDTEGVRATALSVLFDLLHQYGLEVLQIELGGTSYGESPGEESNSTPADESRPGEGLDETEESTEAGEGTDEKAAGPTANTASSLLTILSSALDIESSELRTVAAEGLAKLLLSGRVQSAKLLSHLLLLWYNPVTEDDTHLRHCLGAFFPVFAIAGRSNQEVVEESFMLTMRTLFNAPSSSPLADVDANNVADLLVQLTSSRLLSQNNKISRDQITDHVIHNNLALTVCNEILSHADSFSVRVLVKTLNSLDIDKDDESLLKNLHTLSQQMLEAVKEKTCVKGLQKFQAGLEETLSKYEKPAPPPGGDGHMENTQENAEDVDSESIRPEVKQEPVEGQERCGQGEITADQKPGAITKTPLPKSARKKSKAVKTPSANLTVPVTDLENSVFLSPTPIRKSSAKPKPTNVSCDALDDSKLKALTNGSRKLSNRRVLFDVDNTSLQQPPDAE